MIEKTADYLDGLWIDQENANDLIDKYSDAELKPYLEKFIKDGYVVFENVVPHDVIDQIISDTEKCLEVPAEYVLRNAGVYIDSADLETLGLGDRVIDLYGISKAARQGVHSPIITKFLETIFQNPAVAMQSLSFTYGSQQAIHQDTAYVISKKPLHLAATWLALEDVQPGSGELIYYPGSHRFKHFLFNGELKGWEKKTHGTEQHNLFLRQLHDQAKELGLKQESFSAKKGDILIWHADLAHGGSRLKVEDTTRKSLVTHYVPQNIKPNYLSQVGNNYYEYEFEHPNTSKAVFTSRHYQMSDLDNGDKASIYYDGGVTKRRVKA